MSFQDYSRISISKSVTILLFPPCGSSGVCLGRRVVEVRSCASPSRDLKTDKERKATSKMPKKTPPYELVVTTTAIETTTDNDGRSGSGNEERGFGFSSASGEEGSRMEIYVSLLCKFVRFLCGFQTFHIFVAMALVSG